MAHVLYACGGHDGWAYVRTCERYDPAARTWTPVADLQHARSALATVALNGRLVVTVMRIYFFSIYAVGGRDSSGVLRVCERYNPHTNTWTTVSTCILVMYLVQIAPLNTARSNVAVAVCNGCLYAVGGMDAPSSHPTSAQMASVERYVPRCAGTHTV
jgi:kelch-like protein 1/4/5